MNSQDRMKAGGEHLLDRLKAALQDEKGVQVESLLTCLGALAGYACQVSVRHTAPLMTVATADGTKYLYGDALNAPLAESPLSVWAFIGKAVQKLGAPLPDISEIFTHVTKTLGTSEFGVPRVPDGYQPRDLPLVYLQQLWPQALPIAQRFCDKPVQLPVVFGIALQRALEQTQGVIDATLGARIAMESAVAMSKVTLPEAPQPAAPVAAKPRASAARPQPSGSSVEQQQREALASLPPWPRVVAIVLVAIVAAGGAYLRWDRNQERAAEREARELAAKKWNESLRALERAAAQAQAAENQRKASAPTEAPVQQLPGEAATSEAPIEAPTSQAATDLVSDESPFERVQRPDGSVVIQLKAN